MKQLCKIISFGVFDSKNDTSPSEGPVTESKQGPSYRATYGFASVFECNHTLVTIDMQLKKFKCVYIFLFSFNRLVSLFKFNTLI